MVVIIETVSIHWKNIDFRVLLLLEVNVNGSHFDKKKMAGEILNLPNSFDNPRRRQSRYGSTDGAGCLSHHSFNRGYKLTSNIYTLGEN